MTTTNSNKTNQAIKAINKMRIKAETREQLGVLLYDRLLKEIATGKHFREDGTGKLSVTVHFSTQEINAESAGSMRKFCIEVCVETPDGEIICHKHCRPDWIDG